MSKRPTPRRKPSHPTPAGPSLPAAAPVKLPRGVPQFFFDDSLIAHSQRLTRRWLPAKVHPQPVLVPDKPWEGRAVVLYGTVLPRPDGKGGFRGWRMYYSNFVPSVTFNACPDSGAIPCTMIAESDDGLSWHKPELDIHPFRGKPSNIVFNPGHHWDSPSLLHDPTDKANPYKMVAFSFRSVHKGWDNDWGMYTQVSPDGLRWSPTAVPGAPGRPNLRAGDRSNVMPVKVNGQYVLYTRHVDMAKHTGSRAVYRSVSDDFIKWTEPQLVLAPDLTDEPGVQFYGMPVFERHGWHIGLLESWRDDTDTMEVQFAFSRDGVKWQRPMPHTPFIGPTFDWNRKWNTCASNGPIIVGEQMVFLFGGRHTSHHWDSAQLHGCIGFASLPLDRFCAIEGGPSPAGHLVTPPITWPGGDLGLNADTRKSFDSHPYHCDGVIHVEVLDASGSPLPKWSGDDKAVVVANTHARGHGLPGKVRWPRDRGLDALRGRTVRLKMSLIHARLFTFESLY